MKQKGFTLLEVMVALGVGAVVLLAILLGIFQISWGTVRTNDQVAALADVNYASLWLKKDIQMAQTTSLTDGDPVPQSSVVLSWTDFTSFEVEENKDHTSAYTLSGTELWRTYDGTVSVVGRHISSIGFTQDGGVINVAITATGPGILERTETLGFSVNVHMRPEGVE